jgi:hypothetical protein
MDSMSENSSYNSFESIDCLPISDSILYIQRNEFQKSRRGRNAVTQNYTCIKEDICPLKLKKGRRQNRTQMSRHSPRALAQEQTFMDI